jgi:thiamine kinase-like enzyme
MSELNTNATVTLTVNGRQAQEMLDNLKQKATQLETAIDKARRSGDKASLKRLQKELNQTNAQIKQIQSATASAEDVMRRLDRATPKQLNQTLSLLRRQLNGIERGSEAWTAQVAKIKAVADEMCLGQRLYREGKLPKRICHCDTKVNNMLFDKEGNVLCVIDLDTVMPSFVFSDFGDFLRSAANTGAEDDPDLDNIHFNMEIFEAFTKGYLEGTKSFLLPIERENLPYAATLFPYMQAVRFLTDYINGNTYYKIQYPTHNLVRTRAQWKLYEEAVKCLPEMKQMLGV